MPRSAVPLFLAGAFLPSLLISWTAAWFCRQYATRWALVDRPGPHKLQTSPVPLGGGVAIWFGIVIPIAGGHLLALLATWQWLTIPDFVQLHLAGILARLPGLWLLLGGATLAMVLGLLDDYRGIDWRVRLACEIALGVGTISLAEWRLSLFIGIPLIGAAISVVWIVGLINSFNMLDNMDGLSAGVAWIAAAALIIAAFQIPNPQSQQPQFFIAGFWLIFAGSLAGFLWHNRCPASLYMGDAGAYLIGYLLAVISIAATYASYDSGLWHAVLTPLCVLAVPVYDTTTVAWIRIRGGRSPFLGDRNHFSHRLVDLGLSPKQAVRTIYLLSTACGLAGVLLHRVDALGAVMLAGVIACVLTTIGILEATARRVIIAHHLMAESDKEVEAISEPRMPGP